MSARVARTLLATLRFGPDRDDTLPPAWGQLDPRGVADWLAFEGGALWLWRRLRDLDLVSSVDPALFAWIDGAARRTSARNLLIEAQTDAVTGFLTTHGFPYILLKGAALHAAREVFPYADARGSRDVDVLLPEDQAGTAWDALMKAGYRLQPVPMETPAGHWHLPPIINDAEVAVEIHHSISTRVSAQEVWRRMSGTTRVYRRGRAEFVVPSATELLWHAVTHALETDTRAFRLRHFLDVAALWASNHAIDWTEIGRRIETAEVPDRRRTLTWLGAAAWLANRPFPAGLGTSVPPFDLERAVRWRIAVCAKTAGRHTTREWLLEEATRAEIGMPLTPVIVDAPFFRRVRRPDRGDGREKRLSAVAPGAIASIPPLGDVAAIPLETDSDRAEPRPSSLVFEARVLKSEKEWLMRSMAVLVLVTAVAACGGGTLPAGEVIFGTLTVKQGGVAASAVTGWLNDLHPAMEGCYALALAKNPRTGGAMHLTMNGDQTGTKVEVTRNEVENASLTQCVTQAVHGVKADEKGAFVAEWSVNFNPKG